MSRLRGMLIALSKDWLRSREAVFFSLAFPVILFVIFSAVFAGGSAQFTIFVQNHDVDATGEPTNLSATFVESLEAVDALTVRSLERSRNVSTWARENRTTVAKRVVVVPDGFAAEARNGTIRARQAVINDTMARAGDRMNASDRAAIQRGLDRMQAGASADANASVTFLATTTDSAAPAVRGVVQSVVAEFNDRAIGVESPPVRVESGDLTVENIGSVEYFLPAILAAVILINGVITMTAVVANFNHDGTLKRLAATPLRKREWILANVIHQTVLALVITGILLLIARLMFGVTIVPGPIAIVLILIGAVGFTGVGMALGSFLEDPEAATSLGNAIALPLMFLSGVFWDIELMPEYLQTAARYSPLYHFHRGLRQLMVLDSTEGVLLPFAVMSVGSIIALVFAVRLTRWQDFGQ